MSTNGIPSDASKLSDFVKNWAGEELNGAEGKAKKVFAGLASTEGTITADRIDTFLNADVGSGTVAKAQQRLRELMANNHCQIEKVGEEYQVRFSATEGAGNDSVAAAVATVVDNGAIQGMLSAGNPMSLEDSASSVGERSMSIDDGEGVGKPEVDQETLGSLDGLDPTAARTQLTEGMSLSDKGEFYCSVLYHMSAGVDPEIAPKGMGVADPSLRSSNPEIEKKAVAFVAKCEVEVSEGRDFKRVQLRCLQEAKDSIGTGSNDAMSMQFKLQTLGGANTFQTGKDVFGFVSKTSVAQERLSMEGATGGASFNPVPPDADTYVTQGYQSARYLEALVKDLYPDNDEVAAEALKTLRDQKKIELDPSAEKKWTNEDVSNFLLETFGASSDIFVVARLANQDTMQAASGFMIRPEHLGVSGDPEDRGDDKVAYYSGGYPKSHEIDIMVSPDGRSVQVTQSLTWEEGVYLDRAEGSVEKVEVRSGKEATRSALTQVVTHTFDRDSKEISTKYKAELGQPNRKKKRHAAIQERIGVVMS